MSKIKKFFLILFILIGSLAIVTNLFFVFSIEKIIQEDFNLIYLTRNEINNIIKIDKKTFIDIYEKESKNLTIANIIIESAIENNIPINLAFALCHTESNYIVESKGFNKNKSIDRGLFQLNNKYHTDKDFIWNDPISNTNRALQTLKKIYKKQKLWEISLILYNAGSMNNTGKNSVYYIKKILKKEKELDELFNKTFRDTYNTEIYKKKK